MLYHFNPEPRAARDGGGGALSKTRLPVAVQGGFHHMPETITIAFPRDQLEMLSETTETLRAIKTLLEKNVELLSKALQGPLEVKQTLS